MKTRKQYNTTKKLFTSSGLTTCDVIREAKAKFPGYNFCTALYQYYQLYKQILRLNHNNQEAAERVGIASLLLDGFSEPRKN